MTSQFCNGNTINAQSKNSFPFSGKVILLFLFLASLNFLNRYSYCVFIGFAVFLVLESKNIQISRPVLPLIIFSLSLLVFWSGGNSSVTAMLRTLTFPMCFIMGYNFPAQKNDTLSKERVFKILSVTLALGTWLHLILNLAINFSNEDATRNTVDFWIGDVLSATGQAALACLMIAVAVSCLFSKAKVWIKILAAVALLLVLYYNLILAGRSIFLIFIVTALVSLVYFLKKSDKQERNIKALLWVTVAVIVCIVAYRNNVFGIRDVIADSNFYDRFFGDSASTLTEDSRGNNKLKYLKYLVQHPFGGGNIRAIVGGYAHDLYLDTYDEAGVFAFFSIIIVVIDFAVKTFEILKSKLVSFETKQMLLCMFVVLNIEFWVEPVLAGMSWLLACFCIVYGSVCRLATTLRTNWVSDKV